MLGAQHSNTPRQIRCQALLFSLLICCFLPVDQVHANVENNESNFYEDLDNLRYRHYGDQTLGSLGAIHAIAEDEFGFIWFGGANGLSRWDGYNSRLYPHSDSDLHSMTTDNVNDLATAANGDLWIATYWGLNRYQASSERFIRYNHDPENPRSLNSNAVKNLLVTPKGVLWLGTEGGGLARYVPETDDFDVYRNDPNNPGSLSGNSVTDIAQDANGLLWIAIKHFGINVFDPKSQRVIHRFSNDPDDNSSLSKGQPTSICLDSEGTMWVGTYQGLNKHLGKGKFKKYILDPLVTNTLLASNIHALKLDNKGRLWVGAGDRGASVYDPEIDGFRHAFSEPVVVLNFFNDSSGAQWLGFSEGGAARVDRYAGAIKNYVHEPGNENSLINSQVFALEIDQNKNLWVGTLGGLNHIDLSRDKVTRYEYNEKATEGLPSRSISALLMTSPDEIWVGTPWGGVGRLDLDTQKVKTYMVEEGNPNSLLNREVWSLFQDSKGVVWVGTNLGGLNQYRPESDDFQRYHYSGAGGTTPGRTLSIDEDQYGALWISSDFGLFRFKQEHQTRHALTNTPMSQLFEFFGAEPETEPIFFPVPVLRKAFEDSKKNMWFATFGTGLTRWNRDQGTVKVYNKSHGMVHNNASAIAEDDDGYIWISTEGGISRLDPVNHRFKNFTAANGLSGNTFKTPAGLKLPSGKMAFGGLEGLNIIDPEKLFSNNHQAPLIMTEMYLFNEPVKTTYRYQDIHGGNQDDIPADTLVLPTSINNTKEITLKHNHSVVAFEFSLLNYDVPGKNRYSYKLEGFNSNWTAPSDRRLATYTNLDAGIYQFRVRATNNEGLAMSHELNVRLKVLPPWWETWWAYSLFFIAIAAIIIRIIFAQISKRQFVEAQNKILESKISERTQELMVANEELQVAYKKVQDASYSDALTNLRNRRYFRDTIPKQLAGVVRAFERLSSKEELDNSEQYVGFFLIDIDNFKAINDEFGHANGDIVIKSVSESLVSCTRKADTVFRWGGEEFLVVYPGQPLKSLTIIAERIRQAMESNEIKLDNNQTIIRTCSVGFCHYPFDPQQPTWLNAEQVIDLADRGLYTAKNSGRNSWSGLKFNRTIDESFIQLINNLEQRIEDGVVTQINHSKDEQQNPPNTGTC